VTNKKWKKKCIKKKKNAPWNIVVIHYDFGAGGVIHNPRPPPNIYIYIYIYARARVGGRREQIGSSLPAAIAVEFSFFSLDIPVKSRYFVLKTSGHTPICWRPSWWLWFVKVVFPCLIFRRGPNSMIDKIWGGSGCFFLILPAAQLTEVKIL